MTSVPTMRRARRGVALLLAIAGAGVLLAAGRELVHAWRELHPPRLPVAPLGSRPGLTGFEELSFQASDGVPLRAWWSPARNGAAVVLVHGVGGNREQLLPQALALAHAGFGTLLLDLRAHGASGGDACTWGDRERLDVAAAVDAAAGRPGVRPGRIGLVGFSIGAFAAAEVAIGDRRVAALTLEAMQPTLEQELRHDHSAHGVWSELPEVWAMRALGVRVDEVRPAERLCQLAPRPLLLVYGGADPVAPPDLAARLAHSACGPVERWIVRGGGHGGWDETSTGQVDARLVAFFEGALAR